MRAFAIVTIVAFTSSSFLTTAQATECKNFNLTAKNSSVKFARAKLTINNSGPSDVRVETRVTSSVLKIVKSGEHSTFTADANNRYQLRLVSGGGAASGTICVP